MAVTQFSATDVQQLIVEAWSDIFMEELREQLLLGALVNKSYNGEINQLGDSVKVSQINAPVGQLLTIGTDADSFESQALSTTQVEVKADKRAVAAYELEDTVPLMSQIGNKDSEMRKSLLYSVSQQINDYLYSLMAPSTSSPDHSIASVTDFNAAQLSAARILAAQAKWDKSKGWYCLADPVYYGDLLNASTLTSGDYVPDAPVVGGQIAKQRFGFNIFEDNSLSTDNAYLFHPDFMHMVMKTQPQFKVSDLHSQKKFGYLISCDVIFGAKLGIDGAKKHIRVYNT